ACFHRMSRLGLGLEGRGIACLVGLLGSSSGRGREEYRAGYQEARSQDDDRTPNHVSILANECDLGEVSDLLAAWTAAAPRRDRSSRQRPKMTCKMIMIRAKNVTPSISAAAMIIAVWMFPAISGCRDMLSTEDAASLPIPSAAPRMTKPAPMALRSE